MNEFSATIDVGPGGNNEWLGRVAAAYAVLGTDLGDIEIDVDGLGKRAADHIAAVVKTIDIDTKNVAAIVSEQIWPKMSLLTKALWWFNKGRFTTQIELYLVLSTACDRGAVHIGDAVQKAMRPWSHFLWTKVWRSCGMAWTCIVILAVHDLLRRYFGWGNALDTIADHFLRFNVFFGVHLLCLIVAIVAAIVPKSVASALYTGLYQVETIVYGIFGLRVARDLAFNIIGPRRRRRRPELRDVEQMTFLVLLRLGMYVVVGAGVALLYAGLSRVAPDLLKFAEPVVNAAFLVHYLYAERRQIAEWRTALAAVPRMLRRRIILRREVPRRPPSKTDVCPICLAEFDLNDHDNIIYCKFGCGQPVHRDCFHTWSTDYRNACVFCQAWWG